MVLSSATPSAVPRAVTRVWKASRVLEDPNTIEHNEARRVRRTIQLPGPASQLSPKGPTPAPPDVALPSLWRLEDEAETRRRGQEAEAEDQAEAQAERRRKALAETWRRWAGELALLRWDAERRWAEEAEAGRRRAEEAGAFAFGAPVDVPFSAAALLRPPPPSPPTSGQAKRRAKDLARRARRDLARGPLSG